MYAGPHWDYNSAYEIALGGCEPFDSDTGWVYDMTCWIHGTNFPVPFWWERMLQDTVYTRDLNCRWTQLRSTTLSTANIFNIITSVLAIFDESFLTSLFECIVIFHSPNGDFGKVNYNG